MYKLVDLETWNRKSAFHFFENYDDPFFNMTASVSASRLFDLCKMESLSFSLAMLYFSQKAANSIAEFRMRLLDGVLIEYDLIESTETILPENHNFCFALIEHRNNLLEFVNAGIAARAKYLRLKSFDVERSRLDLIYYSTIPWVSFTSFKSARKFDRNFTIPKITFGKYFRQDGELRVPVSVEVNHRIMDGSHVGKFYETFQAYLLEPQFSL